MSNINAGLEHIKSARRRLEKFRQKLMRPSVAALEGGFSDLSGAVDCLKQAEPILALAERRSPSLEQALRLEVAGLSRELQQVKALMVGAGRFHEGWARLLSSCSEAAGANYTPSGRPGVYDSSKSNHVVIHG